MHRTFDVGVDRLSLLQTDTPIVYSKSLSAMSWHTAQHARARFQFQATVGIKVRLLDRGIPVVKLWKSVEQMQRGLLFRSSRYVDAKYMST